MKEDCVLEKTVRVYFTIRILKWEIIIWNIEAESPKTTISAKDSEEEDLK